MFGGHPLWISRFSAGRSFFSSKTQFHPRVRKEILPLRPRFTKKGQVSSRSKDIRSEDITFDPLLPSGEYNVQSIAMRKSPAVVRDSKKRPRLSDGLPKEVITFEANALLIKHRSEANGDADGTASVASHLELNTTKRLKDSVLPLHTEIELEIEELSSTGDGLAYSKEHDHVFVVPFSVPGDRVLAKTYPQVPNNVYTLTDYLKLVRPSKKREGVTPGCKYFTQCSGCQLQMLPYEDQLQHKKTIVEQAFKRFSNLEPSLIPPVGDTVGSPIQYGYRTKLTPHFGGGGRHGKAHHRKDEPPAIGFNYKGRQSVLDIEQCPIGTPIVNEGMKIERRKTHKIHSSLNNGQTILLRESTQRKLLPSSAPDPAPTEKVSRKEEIPAQDAASPQQDTNDKAPSFVVPFEQPVKSELTYPSPDKPQITLTYTTHEDVKTYTRDHLQLTTEYVGEVAFQTKANSFFQNNNSILPTFVQYVREKCSPPPKNPPSTPSTDPDTPAEPPIKYLLDAYCGSGLFAISLAPAFSSVLGIDIDLHGIASARKNAEDNKLSNVGFIAADADTLFSDVPFPPDQSLIILDPPRKGASESFLQQLCELGPRRVIYVSCNVHTQARDVGFLVQGFGGKWRYEVESLRGFDFFPQTGHVEGVCVLNRVRDDVGGAAITTSA